MNTTIRALYIYPLKSARGVECARVRLTATGFEWDRQWMLTAPDGRFLSQRTHPQLACVVARLTDSTLVLDAPGLPALELPLEPSGEVVPVRVHDDRCVGLDAGEAAATWATRVAGHPARLVRAPPAPERRASARFAGVVPAPMGFADGFPVLVCNTASLEDLNTRLPAPIPMDRFRPNIVLGGFDAWAEDHIDALAIGDVRLALVKPCTRCTIPAVDQATGRPGTDPAPALKAFRFDRALRGVTFGENAVIAAGLGRELTRGAACTAS